MSMKYVLFYLVLLGYERYDRYKEYLPTDVSEKPLLLLNLYPLLIIEDLLKFEFN